MIWFSFGLGYYGIIVLCGSIFSTEEGEELFDYPALLYAAASEVGVLFPFPFFFSFFFFFFFLLWLSGCVCVWGGSFGFLVFPRSGWVTIRRPHCPVWPYLFLRGGGREGGRAV